MKTPIVDFVRKYADDGIVRFHMPGHKGRGADGYIYDITEVEGADSLYEAGGIIAQSEQYASRLFGCPTFYSAEGSSLCIRTMIYLACTRQPAQTRPIIVAGRNAHKTFVTAAALCDAHVRWLPVRSGDSYLQCGCDARDVEALLSDMPQKPCAVYITSPDYLGNISDVASIAEVCHRHGVWLLVDNAHGAYLKFLPESKHPMDLGADMCCDSAHKTLNVLTGGAYLHLRDGLAEGGAPQVKKAMALFGSTSPSYLIMASLDAANAYLADRYPGELGDFVLKVRELKQQLSDQGFEMVGQEPLKITIRTKPYGYRGSEMAQLVRQRGIECEFADPDFITFMLTPQNTTEELEALTEALCAIEPKPPIDEQPPMVTIPQATMTLREAYFAPSVRLRPQQCEGRIMASPNLSCPPAVSFVFCGEVITQEAVKAMAYYGTDFCEVVDISHNGGKGI